MVHTQSPLRTYLTIVFKLHHIKDEKLWEKILTNSKRDLLVSVTQTLRESDAQDPNVKLYLCSKCKTLLYKKIYGFYCPKCKEVIKIENTHSLIDYLLGRRDLDDQ